MIHRRTTLKIALIAAAIAVLDGAAIADAQTAEVLFTEGQAAYDRADYAAAIAKWQASYQLSSEPELLFDVAQAMRLAGDCRGAIANYQRFAEVGRADQADQVAMARDFVRELGSWCRDVPAPVPAPPAVNKATVDEKALREIAADVGRPLLDQARLEETALRRRQRRLKTAGIALGAGGLAAIAAGLGLGHHGGVLGEEVTTACRTSCYWGSEKAVDAVGRQDVQIGYAIDGVGVAAIVGGGIAYYLGVRGGAIEPREGGAVVAWRGAW